MKPEADVAKSWKALLEKFKEACMEEKVTITLGNILDLLGRDDTDLTVYEPLDTECALRGPAVCDLWERLEDLPVQSIGVDSDVLEVWLDDAE